MPRNVHFSKSKILHINHLKARGLKIVGIARKTGLKRAGFYQILSKSDNFETWLRPGWSKKTTKRQDRKIFGIVSTPNLSVRSISREVIVPVSKSAVHRRLQVSKLLNYRLILRTPNLTKRHKDARVQWARNHVNWTDEWLSVLFSD